VDKALLHTQILPVGARVCWGGIPARWYDFQKVFPGAQKHRGILDTILDALTNPMYIPRVGQNHIYAPYMTVYSQKYRIYTVFVWFWPTLCIYRSCNVHT